MQRYHVPDMSCGHCVKAITQALQSLDPAARVKTDLSSHEVSVESGRDSQAIMQVLKEAGYPGQALDD